MPELKPCPKCGGDIIIWVNIERGAYAKCVDCKRNILYVVLKMFRHIKV